MTTYNIFRTAAALLLSYVAPPQTHAWLAQFEAGNRLMAQGRHAEAERAFQEAVDAGRLSAPGDPNLANALNNLGNTQRTLGRYPDAERNLREALSKKREVLGPITMRSPRR